MLNWLFKKAVVIQDNTFSSLPIGQKFRKSGWDDKKVYVKTSNERYETADTGWRCPAWNVVTEDFEIIPVTEN